MCLEGILPVFTEPFHNNESGEPRKSNDHLYEHPAAWPQGFLRGGNLSASCMYDMPAQRPHPFSAPYFFL